MLYVYIYVYIYVMYVFLTTSIKSAGISMVNC
jgi:hypothetical protein